MSQDIWYVVEAIALREAHEAISYALMEEGALGTETGEIDSARLNVTGYFETRPDVETMRAALLDALRIYNLPAGAVIDLQLSEIPDRDWLAEWKKAWRPVEVGRFIIAPPWTEVTEPLAVASGLKRQRGIHSESHDPLATARGSDTIIIRIKPGMAFGTGTHETTRLCLRAIEKYFRGGSFLDVGTGTGILAIAAARMFPSSRVEACDTDAEAIEIAKENGRQNGVGEQITFRVGSVDEQTPSADLVCANLTAPAIVDLLPLLLGATCGRLILSGILDSQIDLVGSRLLELGVDGVEIDRDGEWIALIV